VSDSGARAFAEAIKVNKSLKVLNLCILFIQQIKLDHCWIGVTGGKALGESLEFNKTLEELNLSIL